MFASQWQHEYTHTNTNNRKGKPEGTSSRPPDMNWRSGYNKSNNHHENAKRNSFLQTLYYFRILSIDASMLLDLQRFDSSNGLCSHSRIFLPYLPLKLLPFQFSYSCSFFAVFFIFSFHSNLSVLWFFGSFVRSFVVSFLFFIVLFLITVSFFSQFAVFAKLQHDALLKCAHIPLSTTAIDKR